MAAHTATHGARRLAPGHLRPRPPEKRHHLTASKPNPRAGTHRAASEGGHPPDSLGSDPGHLMVYMGQPPVRGSAPMIPWNPTPIKASFHDRVPNYGGSEFALRNAVLGPRATDASRHRGNSLGGRRSCRSAPAPARYARSARLSLSRQPGSGAMFCAVMETEAMCGLVRLRPVEKSELPELMRIHTDPDVPGESSGSASGWPRLMSSRGAGPRMVWSARDRRRWRLASAKGAVSAW